MKIVNTYDKPFSGMFNGRKYGPFIKGKPVDLPDNVALHMIRQSNNLDELGNVESYRMVTLDQAKADGNSDLLQYECPLVSSGECKAEPFKSLDDLKAHMEIHWGSSTKTQSANAGKQGQQQKGLADL